MIMHGWAVPEPHPHTQTLSDSRGEPASTAASMFQKIPLGGTRMATRQDLDHASNGMHRILTSCS